MRIESARIINYKSFRDTGPVTFHDGFNVIVGQNNVGKTSLIEALSLSFKGNPHKNISVRRGMGNPSSLVEISLTIDGDALRDTLFQRLQYFNLPLGNSSADKDFAVGKLNEILRCEAFKFRYQVTTELGDEVSAVQCAVRLSFPRLFVFQQAAVMLPVSAADR